MQETMWNSKWERGRITKLSDNWKQNILKWGLGLAPNFRSAAMF